MRGRCKRECGRQPSQRRSQCALSSDLHEGEGRTAGGLECIYHPRRRECVQHVIPGKREETEGRALDVVPCPVRVVLDIAKVLCGRSGEEWESLRFLEETVLGNESLHSRRFLGRGVAQPLCSVESCIPGDPPCVGWHRNRGGRIKVIAFSHVFPARHHILHDRWQTANAVYMFQ